jgi:hypothetical protein
MAVLRESVEKDPVLILDEFVQTSPRTQDDQTYMRITIIKPPASNEGLPVNIGLKPFFDSSRHLPSWNTEKKTC